MRKRNACFVAGAIAVLSPGMSACVSSQDKTFATAFAVDTSACQSRLEEKQRHAGKLQTLSDAVFKPGRSACDDLIEIYSLKKAINVADLRARRVCPPSTFTSAKCDQECLERDLASIRLAKGKYCSHK
jgi:hypothetical protein